MAIRVDFSQVSNVIPEGVYDAVIVNAEEKTSKQGKPMLQFDFSVSTDKGDRTMAVFCSLQSNALFKLAEVLGACGYEFDWEDPESLADVEFEPEDLVGSEVKVRVETQTYNEQERSAIAEVMRPVSRPKEKPKAKGK